jgi:hypothetical protein
MSPFLNLIPSDSPTVNTKCPRESDPLLDLIVNEWIHSILVASGQ